MKVYSNRVTRFKTQSPKGRIGRTEINITDVYVDVLPPCIRLITPGEVPVSLLTDDYLPRSHIVQIHKSYVQWV
jgi:hypothetical protein